MKNILFALSLLDPFICVAQPGYITHVAGSSTAGFSGDGGPATAAAMGKATGVAADAFGNVYITDDENDRIRRISPFGTITTFAGGGSSSAESIPATAALLDLSALVGVLFLDAAGNVYINSANRIRKIDVATNLITTIAGNGIAGSGGDGGPATAASLSGVNDIYIDVSGEVYISDAGNNRIRRIDASGTITTFAGTGAWGFSGDGGPATNAAMRGPAGICRDAAGNTYISDQNRIRKINVAGIISTFAGTDTAGFSGDGGPATVSEFNRPAHLRTDALGNLFIADSYNNRVRKITPDGMIDTYAGGGTSSAGSGIAATSASFLQVWGIGVDPFNTLYVADYHNRRVLNIGAPVSSVAATVDSFFVQTSTNCISTFFSITPTNLSGTHSVETNFGDGIVQTDPCSLGGKAWFSHTYSMPGTYTIKHRLLNGGIPVDSVSHSYTHLLCRTFLLKVFADNNANCVYDTSTDFLVSSPFVFSVDSAGVPIDTLSCTSGLYYQAYGPVGTIYSFRVISAPPGVTLSCPVTGIINHTLTATMPVVTDYLGVTCSSTPGYDLRLFTSFRAGGHNFNGIILADNLYCTPTPATLTMHLSPKYSSFLYFFPAATSIVGNIVTWDVGFLSSNMSGPLKINVDAEAPTGTTTWGDTLMTSYFISPDAGDANPSDNIIVRIDTIKSSHDPNDISVSPAGCLTDDVSSLTYTIRFENTGNDTAFNIYVLDTLPAEVEPMSMRIQAASAVMNTFVTKSGSQNIVRFDFPNIYLPDSSHHGLNSDMVVYSIRRRSGLLPGTAIQNRVGIYFDDNPPVLTNTAVNVVGCPPIVSVHTVTQTKVALNPNPVSDALTITTDAGVYKEYIITNSIGSIVSRGALAEASTIVNVRGLAAGVYYVSLQGIGKTVHKLIKL